MEIKDPIGIATIYINYRSRRTHGIDNLLIENAITFIETINVFPLEDLYAKVRSDNPYIHEQVKKIYKLLASNINDFSGYTFSSQALNLILDYGNNILEG